ncbi:beta strand repeat-containing protein, partial [Selenomonas ruminantium]
MRTIKDKKKEQERLTRLVLCGLLLGGSILYAPVAEAEDTKAEVTGSPSNNYTGTSKMGTGVLYTNDNYWLSFDTDDSSWSGYTIYGGYLLMSPLTGRTVVMERGTVNRVYGADGGSTSTAVSNNTVTIKTGTVSLAVQGGFSTNGDVTENSVTIGVENATSGPTVGSVIGGSSDQGEASNNTVTIHNGEVTGEISGGNTYNNNTNDNTVIIKGGTFHIGSGDSNRYIYGGHSSLGTANNNTVTIEGGTFTNSVIIAGRGESSASGNTVNINRAASGISVLVGGIAHSIYTPSDNTLNLGTAGIQLVNGGSDGGLVNGFGTIAITSGVTFTANGTVLSTPGNILNAPVLDLTGATGLTSATTTTGNKTMTLLSASGTNSVAQVKVSSGTKTLNTYGVIANAGTSSTSADKGVTLGYGANGGVVSKDSTGKKVEYTVGNVVNSVTLGDMTWGDGRVLTANAYKFIGGQKTGTGADSPDATTINASNLNLSTNTALATNASMTLLSNATGLTANNQVTGGTGKTVSIDYTDDDKGIQYGATATGNVTAAANALNYTVSGVTLNSIDLSNWKGVASTLPNSGWTGSNVAVATGDFASEPTTKVDIFTTDITGLFNDDYITGNKKYQGDTTTLVDDTAKGVTLTGYKGGGVKATDSGKKLSYFKELMDTQSITLGEMTWGDGRTAASGYNFANIGNNEIDATNLTFTNPAAATDSMDLLSGATDLQAGLTIVNPNHSQNFTGSAAANGATLDGTINGTVATTAKKITYTVGSKNITGIDLAGWDGNSTALDGWTAATSGVAVKAEGFTAPTLTAGTSKDIFTTSGTGFFNDTNITGAQKYGASATPSSDTVNGVTFTGSQEKGVKASDNGQNLVYAVGDMTVSDITLGNMEVGTGGTVTKRTADGNYTFNDTTKIDATNLKFDKPADVADSTLVTSATGITSSNPVTGASHSQAITGAAMGGGITASGTLHGTVAADTNAVKYTVTDKTVSSMDLSGWDGTTTVNGLPNNWTGSNVAVSTGTFTAPTADKTIFTTNIGGFFGDVTGAMAYKSGAAFSGDVDAGVTLSGTKSGGVKKSDDGKNLNFIAELKTVNNIALGNMDWGTGRAIIGNYDFSTVANNGVDASGLNFNFTGDTVNTISSSTPVWNLVTDATGLNGSLTVKGSPVSQTVSYGINNVANLTGTLTGDVTTANDTVQYKVTGKTLDKVDISNWDGSTVNTALNTSWSKKVSGITVTGSGFTTPTAVGDYTILTADINHFNNAQIADSIAYKTGSTFSETESNITLSGTQDRGVKASLDGTKLQYSIGKANINNIKIGNVTYTKNGTLINKSAALYDYSQLNSNGLDISGFGLSMTDEQKKSAAANDSMTLVQANDTLSNIAAKETGKSTYTYDATSGLAVKGAVTGAVAATNNNVVYTVTGNTASTLTFGTVAWNTGTYARQASEIAYEDALVNADNITFTSDTALNVGDTMVLVSNYSDSDSVNKIRSGIFTLNGQTGKGQAYFENGNLYYKITRAAGTSVPTVNAIGSREIVDSNPDYNNPAGVPGGQAKGGGESKDNETIINNSHIKKNTDGTGGDANGGTSEDGDADKNHLTVNNSTVDGDANGGQSDTGNTDDNETIIKKSIIHGGVAGGETLGGHGGSRRNKTTVEESTVEGDVDGGKTGGSGNTEENHVILTGSKVGGDVNGGHSGGSGGSKGNETTLDGTEVGGDVNGGKTDGNGETKGNEANVKNGSKVTGTVTGGRSGGNGDCTGNAAEVEGSEVGGDVNGG